MTLLDLVIGITFLLSLVAIVVNLICLVKEYLISEKIWNKNKGVRNEKR